MGRKVFVSYARDDRLLVERLVADLRASGHVPFFDEELAGGQAWWEQLLAHIEDCDTFMPALTQRYLNSVPCKLEAEYAGALNRPFLPIAFEPISPRFCVPLIAESQWVTYDPDRRETILDLMRGMNALEAAPPLPESMPARPAAPVSYLTELKAKIDSPTDISRQDQVVLLAELKNRLNGDEAQDVVVLLERLRSRPDITHGVATEIDGLVTAHRAPAPRTSTAPAPEHPAPAPQQHPHPQSPQTMPPPPQQVWRPSQGAQVPKPKSYMLWSVLTTLLCCLPFGVAAIYYSSQVDKKYLAGDIAGATAASGRAKTWLVVAAVTGIVVLIVGAAISIANSSNSNSGF